MFFTIFLAIVLIVSLALLVRLVWRRLPELRVLDISQIPEERRDSSKKNILEARFKREKETAGKKLDKLVGPMKEKMQTSVKKLSESITVLENKYKRHGEVEEARAKSIDELFTEARSQIVSGDYATAEKNLIEVVARDKKNLTAYELLADLYRQSKSYGQAEEVIRYIIKLKSLKYRKNKSDDTLKKDRMEDAEAEMLETINVDSDLARYYDDLAKVYELTDKKDKALEAYLKANAILPNNPKFLDKVIDLGISVGDKSLAKKTYKRLKEINPENAKLEVFREALEKMK